MQDIILTHDIAAIEAFLALKQKESVLPLASAGIQHEHFHCGFYLLENNEMIGVAILYSSPLSFNSKSTWVLGNFEWPNDRSSFSKLITLAKSECRKHDIQQLAGPMNGSTWNTYRFRIETPTEQPLFLTEKYNADYYPELWNTVFESTVDYFSAIDYQLKSDQPELTETKNRLLNNGLTVRLIQLTDLENELRRLHAFNHVAFQTNQFYSPISENAFVEKYIEAQKLISPDYVRIAEDAEGHPVGFVFTFPDLMYREGKRLIVKTLARHPDNKWRGLGMHLISEVFSKAKSDGFTTAIHAFMAQAGTSAPVSGHLGSSNYAHYKLYISLI